MSIASGARRLDDVLGLETTVDLGDSYTPSLRGSPELLRLHTVRLGVQGPRAPACYCTGSAPWPREQVRVSTEIILDAGASHVRCDVRGWNPAQSSTPTGVAHRRPGAARVTADAPSGRLRTSTAAVPDALPFEMPASPCRCTDGCRRRTTIGGVTLISDGLCEGDPGGHRLVVTLVRAIGELSRAELPERLGDAGWPSAIPAAQCQVALPRGSDCCSMAHGLMRHWMMSRRRRRRCCCHWLARAGVTSPGPRVLAGPTPCR
ncbi:MAG: hypothetical protein IPP90_20960 [Gemmatimonadaceae bacterium]|nr:hypothetical protein [Gemmatimonadaceae bacterium]